MSGFEVIGVIFAVYPCIMDALALYKDTKAGKGAASLSRNLKTESIIFGDFIYHLLAPSVSDDEYARLKDPKSPNLGLWENSKLQSHLRTRLGSERAELVVEILQEMKTILSSLEHELSPDRNEHSIVRNKCANQKSFDHTTEFRHRSFSGSFAPPSAM